MATRKVIIKLVALSVFWPPVVCFAKVTGQCANCHTMHNSQGGAAVVQNMVNGSMVLSASPNEALLTTNCIGCHQGNNSVGDRTTPYVLQTSAPVYNKTGTESDTSTLAGGNFYWVSSGFDATGHNVSDITSPDDTRFPGNVPPGGTGVRPQLTCAGSSGCHGDRSVDGEVPSMLTAHHGNDMSSYKDGSSLPASYRFLLGVKGLEDTEYEYRPASTQHNKYYGIDRSLETQNVDGTISNLCAECHGDFHQGSGKIASGSFGTSGVWLRHPTDFDMGRAASSTEYESYNGGTGANNVYSVVAPVATNSTSEILNTTIYTASGDAIVMCLSCHRAHGTPHQAILRWDYKAWPEDTTAVNGCAVCHTTKD